MVEKIHIFITIIAALVVNICCIASSNTLYKTCIYLVITIIVFYFIGLYIRSILTKMFLEKEEDKENENENNTDELDTENTPEEIKTGNTKQ